MTRQRITAWRRDAIEATRGPDEWPGGHPGDRHRRWVPAPEVEVQLEDGSWVPLLNRTVVEDEDGAWLVSDQGDQK